MGKPEFSISFTVLAAFMISNGETIAADADLSNSQASLPAVSGPNGKISGGGIGGVDEFGIVEGSFSIPLGFIAGLQIDGLAGFDDEDASIAFGSHLFWRDPHHGLFGVYGGYANVDIGNVDVNLFAIGLEGQAYLDKFSLEGIAGYEDGNNYDDGIFGIANLAVYPWENLRLFGGIRHINDETFGAVGVEYQFSGVLDIQNASIFAEDRFTDDGDHQFWAGVRVHFGEAKSLLRRHREDDPFNPSLDFLFASSLNSADSPVLPTPAPEPSPP